ncbi:WD40-repeat-containing domain protein [Tribonema minus]|uniref:WD40-repeat-containing domain protein n=1 Tax=Tribonema minus TaxID=303371 RepID=A0A835YKH3_9STRA|nr:WD40-repeat-containing domain protein [Tribonema minus]
MDAEEGGSGAARREERRHIPSTPVRTLDAPDLEDDYYLNLISWGGGNVIAVALSQAVYLWNAATGAIHHLLTTPVQGDIVTSVQWATGGGAAQLAVGTAAGAVQLWDAAECRQVRAMGGHTARVGSLSWRDTHTVSSGSRDATIRSHDVRAAARGGGGGAAVYAGHRQEVCGLAWNADGRTLASGGNENFLCLWDAAASGGARAGGVNGAAQPAAQHRPRLTLTEHCAAVKALAWSPQQRHLLASGGGSDDRCIKTWNVANGALLQSVDTESQVCSLLWSTRTRELVSSHGYSQNQLCVWRYPAMQRVKELQGHTARVLHTALSPDGATVVSAAADETLRFWEVFANVPARRGGGGGGGGGGGSGGGRQQALHGLSAMQLR